MAWTAEQKSLLGQTFSLANKEHKGLIKEKLSEFNKFKQQQVLMNRKIGLGFGASFVLSFFGPSIILFRASDLAYLALGAYIWHGRTTGYYKYAETFKEMLDIYDWSIPNGSQLPLVDNVVMQGLIETLGTLIDDGRIQRLSPLMNGDKGQNLVFSVFKSATQNLKNTSVGFFASQDESEGQVMPPEMFSLLVRQLVQGKSKSAIDYYLYGMGRLQVEDYIKKGWEVMPENVKHFLNKEVEKEVNLSKQI